jgi:uncharacterized protein (TIGR02118 family)
MESDMALMIVIYRRPPDPEAFDKHYFDVHVPLARKLPGLRKYEVSTGPIASLAGAQDCHQVAILHFDDLAAIRAAFASEIGQVCAADRKVFAPNDADVQMFLFETQDVRSK